jgi:hypothetical protein
MWIKPLLNKLKAGRAPSLLNDLRMYGASPAVTPKFYCGSKLKMVREYFDLRAPQARTSSLTSRVQWDAITRSIRPRI